MHAILLCILSLLATTGGIRRVRPVSSVSIRVPEPSDIALSPRGFYIVSDDGLVFETDSSGGILRKSGFGAYDLEAISHSEKGIWVLDERTRFASRLDPLTLQPEKTVEIPYSGGRNKGFEALTWNPGRGTFLAVTESNPVWFFELDTAFRVVNRLMPGQMREGLSRDSLLRASDVSAVTWSRGKLFILSDEDHAVYRLDARSFRKEAVFELGILNPEGLVFSGSHLVVVSDDEGKLYRYAASEFFD